MALPPVATLVDVRKAVAIRCNFGNQPQRVKQVQPVLDEYIQESHAFLAGLCDWTVGLRFASIPLVDGEQEYDFPDDCLPGNIDQITVVDTNGFEHELQFGMRPQERNSAVITAKSQPLRIEIFNGVMKLWPPPDVSSWPSMQIRYRATALRPMKDTDTIVVDMETLVKFAAHKVRKHFGMPELESPQELDEYLKIMVAQQSDGEVFGFIGMQSFKNRRPKLNRINANVSPVSGPGWNPPGVW